MTTIEPFSLKKQQLATSEKIPHNLKEWFGKRHFYHCIELAPGFVTPGYVNYLDGLHPICEILPVNYTNKMVLDIGCCDGYFSFLAAYRAAKRVFAIESCPHFAENFQRVQSLLRFPHLKLTYHR